MLSEYMSTCLHFNEDITLEILSWLPAEEIVRLRCVSRRWRSLLFDPGFVAKHAARNPRPPASSFFLRDNFHHTEHFPLVDSSASGAPGPVLPFPPACAAGRDRVSVSASCNGLLVCCRATPGFYGFRRHHVCNPTTGESVELPLPDGAGRYLSLAFDPSRSSHYEVAAAGRGVHLYSSRTRSWRLSVDEASLGELGGFHLHRGVYWDGQLVWVGKECIMSFRAEEDRMKKLPTPPPNSYDCSRVLYIGESGGKLQMITIPGNESVLVSTRMVILELGSGASSRWSVLQHLDLASIPRPICRASGSYAQVARECREFSPVHFVGPEGVLLLSVPGKILSYRLEDRAFRKVCDVPTPPAGSFYCPYDWYKFFPLAHTLFSP